MSRYDEQHDDLAADATSRVSPYLHFGALSPVELARQARAQGGPGVEASVRRLCWRDFHHQVLAARPESSVRDYRTRHDRWRTEDEAAEDIAAWREGRTGYPVVDAAMRQLRHEGWMHNRGRLLVAGFLTRTLYVDWRIGARHFPDLLVDGDIVNNQLNWQWAAGTGTDTRPHRVLNPVLQGRRYDPSGAYVRRWVPELQDMDDRAVHEPWRLPEDRRAGLRHPAPLIGLADGAARFRHARGRVWGATRRTQASAYLPPLRSPWLSRRRPLPAVLLELRRPASRRPGDRRAEPSPGDLRRWAGGVSGSPDRPPTGRQIGASAPRWGTEAQVYR
ncbi:hypothetical protein GCM10010381_65590 [Streptomyces xantholiticus]|nr:hypothetical protein GCM10010381_65590 [Streptomyces xantholiticus]